MKIVPDGAPWKISQGKAQVELNRFPIAGWTSAILASSCQRRTRSAGRQKSS